MLSSRNKSGFSIYPVRQLLISIVLIWLFVRGRQLDDSSAVDEVTRTAAQMIRLRGFMVEEYYVKSGGVGVIQLLRIKNPAIRGPIRSDKKTVLLIHGLFVSASYFVANSVDARPQDLSNLDSFAPNIEALLVQDPTSNSLPMLLSNFGHDVWLINRRPTIESQDANGQTSFHVPLMDINESIRPTSNGRSIFQALSELSYGVSTSFNPFILSQAVNPNYWDYSLDEQALEDLPNAIDFILAQTQRTKLTLVGHSLGGALVLILMSERHDYDHKIEKAILYGPSLFLGHNKKTVFGQTAMSLEPVLRSLIAPLPPSALVTFIQGITTEICAAWLSPTAVCSPFLDQILGAGSEQLHLRPGFIRSFSATGSTHEMAHLMQGIRDNLLRYFDFGDANKNFNRYRSIEAPQYNLASIDTRKLSIWGGNTDMQVSFDDLNSLFAFMQPVADVRLLNPPGLRLNHFSFQFHRNVSALINIPSLRIIES